MCKSEGVIEDDINQLFIAIIHFVIARVEKYLLHHITIYLYSCLVTFLRVSFFIEACLEHKLGSSVSAITLMFVLHNPVLNLSSVPTLNYIILSFLYNINLSFIFCMSSLQRKKNICLPIDESGSVLHFFAIVRNQYWQVERVIGYCKVF